VLPAATEGVAGVTEIAVKTAAVTVKVAEPLTLPEVAAMVAVPGATLVASPALFTVATATADELHLAVLLRFCVLPLLYVPVAVNCWVLPAATEALAGVTESEVKTAAVTVSVAEPVIAPDLAVMVVVPGATVVANPLALIFAIVVADELQFAELVRFCVLPLL